MATILEQPSILDINTRLPGLKCAPTDGPQEKQVLSLTDIGQEPLRPVQRSRPTTRKTSPASIFLWASGVPALVPEARLGERMPSSSLG